MRKWALGAAILLAIVWLMRPSAETGPGIDPVTSASITPNTRDAYSVANLSTGTACTAARGEVTTARSRAFDPQSGCDAVWPGLSQARNWTENEDGSVVLSKASGEAVLTIAPGDGVDYEALDPDNAVVALTRLR